jgi:hypothetical protein
MYSSKRHQAVVILHYGTLKTDEWKPALMNYLQNKCDDCRPVW